MSDKLQQLNLVYERVKMRTNGNLHNDLWQVMMNGSLGRTEGAFIEIGSDPNHRAGIALEDGGYIPANFGLIGETDQERQETLDILNQEVFGFTPDAAWRIIAKSMTAGK